ncbi:MAG: hypothetical protein JWM74_771, partial [Myxococcaceae bacterium]|nr:hypothetical protein [Myxococcaceae bacterium]
GRTPPLAGRPMSEPPAPFKKKSPPATLPRALDEGVAPRPLFPAYRVTIPVGLVAIGAIAFLEMSPTTVDREACSTVYKPSIFDRGAEAAKEAFDRMMGRSYSSPGRGTPSIAGAVAVMPPEGTTTPSGSTVLPSQLGVIGPAVGTADPGESGERLVDTGHTTAPTVRHIPPTLRYHTAGRPVGPRPLK